MHGRGVVLGLVLSLAIGTGAWAKVPVRPAADLDQLLGPIALYPDPLLAQVLPAATAPDDLALAVKFLEDGGDLGQVDAQPWNDNAKALARYPEVLRMMNRSRDWTDAVGAAFLDQRKDVMDSIQRLRAAAMASGALQTTNEQRVVAEKGIVCIYPDDPSAIHLPQYDPKAVYASQSTPGGKGLITFGSVLLVGYWLNYELDWRKHRVYSYDCQEFPYGRRNPWYFGGQNGSEVFPNIPKQRNQEWKPDKHKMRPFAVLDEPLPTIQNFSAPAEAPTDNEPAKPKTESRPLSAPKDLPPPPPDLKPVDPEMESLEESPAAKPSRPAVGVQKPVERAPQSPKAVQPKPAAVKPIPGKPAKASPAEVKSIPAKAGKAKSVEEKAVPAKAGKTKPVEENAAAAKAGKANAAGTKPSSSKKGKAEPEKAAPVSAKTPKAKPAETKTPSAKTPKVNSTPPTSGKGKSADTASSQVKQTQSESNEQKSSATKSGKAKPAETKQSSQ